MKTLNDEGDVNYTDIPRLSLFALEKEKKENENGKNFGRLRVQRWGLIHHRQRRARFPSLWTSLTRPTIIS